MVYVVVVVVVAAAAAAAAVVAFIQKRAETAAISRGTSHVRTKQRCMYTISG